MLDTPEKKKSIVVTPDMPIQMPTFGDWIACGEVSRLLRVVSANGEEAVEFRTNEAAVLRWLTSATGLDNADVVTMPASVGRAIYARMITAIPAFAYAKIRADDPVRETPEGIEIVLKKPLPGHRQQHERLLFRNPTFGDVIHAGDFTTLRVLKGSALGDDAPATEEIINPEAVGRWFQRLSGLPFPILALMSYEDAWTAFAHLRPRISEISSDPLDVPSTASGSVAA